MNGIRTPTTMYDEDVNGGVPVDIHSVSFSYAVQVKQGINDVNEKSSSLDEEDLFPTNSWRGLMSGDVTIKGIIDRRLYDQSNIITKALMDSFVKSPNSKLIVHEVHGAKFYDITNIAYTTKKMGVEEIRSDVTTTVNSTASSGSSTLMVGDSTGLYANMIIKAYGSGSSGNYELCEISSIDGNTLTLRTKTIMQHSAGANVEYDATQDVPVFTYTLTLTRCRDPSTY